MAFAWADATLTFELAFGFTFTDTNPSWTDITDYVDGFNIKGGRSAQQNEFQGRTSVWTLDNSDDRFNPGNSASPYDPDVVLGVPARLTVNHSSTDYVVFRGLVDEWPIEYSHGPSMSRVQLPLTDLTKVLRRTGPTGSRTGRKSGAMVTEVLDDVFWPSNMRDIDTGVADIPDLDFDEVEATAVQYLQWIANAEAGHFFVAANGDATFRERTANAGGVTSQATFGPGASEIRYEDVEVTYNADDVYSQVQVHKHTGEDYANGTAWAYGSVVSPLGYESILDIDAAVENYAHGTNVGEWLVARYGTLRPRIRRIAFAPNVIDAWVAALNLDLRDVVTVKVPGANGSDDLEQVCAIEHIEHSASKGGKWVTAWDVYPLSSLEQEEFWILGTSQLGTGTNLA